MFTCGLTIGVMEKCNFSYILHWNPDFQRELVLEIDFVRFRLQEYSAAREQSGENCSHFCCQESDGKM